MADNTAINISPFIIVSQKFNEFGKYTAGNKILCRNMTTLNNIFKILRLNKIKGEIFISLLPKIIVRAFFHFSGKALVYRILFYEILRIFISEEWETTRLFNFYYKSSRVNYLHFTNMIRLRCLPSLLSIEECSTRRLAKYLKRKLVISYNNYRISH